MGKNTAHDEDGHHDCSQVSNYSLHCSRHMWEKFTVATKYGTIFVIILVIMVIAILVS